jgi:acetolactate decarboxylase
MSRLNISIGGAVYKPNKLLAISAINAYFLVLMSIAGCSPAAVPSVYADNPIANRETLTQVSTINALMAGVYDGVITSGELKGYGDFGIGTFEGLDGEMVELDGKLYQIQADGVAYTVADSLKLPFAEVTFLDNDREEEIPQGTSLASLQQALDRILPSPNIFCAIKITGNFSYVRTRSVPVQTKPYPVLTKVTKNQSIFEFSNVEGTIVGFRCPQYINGINVPGYHLHFLTADFEAGGHVLELTTDSVTATLDYTPEFLLILPEMDSDFYKINLSGDASQAIQQAEK